VGRVEVGWVDVDVGQVDVDVDANESLCWLLASLKVDNGTSYSLVQYIFRISFSMTC